MKQFKIKGSKAKGTNVYLRFYDAKNEMKAFIAGAVRRNGTEISEGIIELTPDKKEYVTVLGRYLTVQTIRLYGPKELEYEELQVSLSDGNTYDISMIYADELANLVYLLTHRA